MKKYIKAAAMTGLCLSIFGASAGVSGAYLKKSINELNNVITPGSVEIELEEPGWEPENGKNLVPREHVSKDPAVTNTGKNDAWVFLKVDVPVRNISLVDSETRRKEARSRHELFSFETKDGWELVDRSEEEEMVHYVYGYQRILGPGESTEPLFEELVFVNVLEGELPEDESWRVPVQAVAIQGNVDSAQDGLETIYGDYLAQEAADGKEVM